MIWKGVLLLSVLAFAVGDKKHAISEQKVTRYFGHHGELSHIGHHEPKHHEVYAPEYPKYEFEYLVDDPYTHDNKGQNEVRDGDEVHGMYWLIQPDGLKRIVKYHSDDKGGFHADVEYVSHDGVHHVEHHGHKDEHKDDHHEEHGHKEEAHVEVEHKEEHHVEHKGEHKKDHGLEKHDGHDGKRDHDRHDGHHHEHHHHEGYRHHSGYHHHYDGYRRHDDGHHPHFGYRSPLPYSSRLH